MKKIVIFLGAFIGCIGLYAQYTNQKDALGGQTTATQREQLQESQEDFSNEERAQPQGDEFDPEKRRKEVVALVERGINYFQKHSLDQACSEFTHTKNFIKGELYLFIYDVQGNCLAHGNQAHLLWENLYDLKDKFGTPIVRNIINKAKEGGGWVTYNWRNAVKLSYVQTVTKEGKDYIIGSGYFPHSKRAEVVHLVNSGVRVFEENKKLGNPPKWAFARMSYPVGQFYIGDIYLFGIDQEGTSIVQANKPGFVGVNDLDWQDEAGKYVNRELIGIFEKTDEPIWQDYIIRNAHKQTYCQKVLDKSGRKYYICGGYHPDANLKKAIDFVRLGYTFLKGHGLLIASNEFTNNNEWRFGDLYLYILDMKGICLAHGQDKDMVDQDLTIREDEETRQFIKQVIQKAKDGGGWVVSKIRHFFKAAYVRKVDLGIDLYIIATDFYHLSTHEAMMLLIKSGVSYLKTNKREKAFAEFVKRDGNFVRGDLFLFAFDTEGICYAYGDDFGLIWRNLIGWKDDDGKPFIKIMINTITEHGPGPVRYTLNGAQRISYIESLEKDGKTYLIGSGYYI